jgi:hypothetical protein
MSSSPSSRCWLWAWGLFAAAACEDRPLNLLPDSLQPAVAGGSPGFMAGTGGSLPGAGSNGAGEAAGGGRAGAAESGGGSLSGGGSGGSFGGGSFGGGSFGGGSFGGSFGGGSFSGGGSGGDQGGAGRGGSVGANAGTGGGGGKTCQSDADCAPPTPGCSPTAHVCKQCSKSSQCPNGQTCSVTEGECGN